MTATLADFTRRSVGIPVSVHPTVATPQVLGLVLGIGAAGVASIVPCAVRGAPTSLLSSPEQKLIDHPRRARDRRAPNTDT